MEDKNKRMVYLIYPFKVSGIAYVFLYLNDCIYIVCIHVRDSDELAVVQVLIRAQKTNIIILIYYLSNCASLILK